VEHGYLSPDGCYVLIIDIFSDSTMGHAYIAKDCGSALILAVCSSDDTNLSEALIRLANQDAPAQTD
jgi:hypothetical protein